MIATRASGSTAQGFRRAPQPAETIATETIQWLAALPAEVRPRLLPVQFARVANTLARRWAFRQACLSYLDDLLIDKRGNRRGFPIGIVLELAALKNYFQTVLHPSPLTVWEEISGRKREGQA